MATSAAWTLELEAAHVEELRSALASVQGVALEDITAAAFPLPTLAEACRCIQADIEGGRGFILLRGMPVLDAEEDVARMFWGLGTHLGSVSPGTAVLSVLAEVRVVCSRGNRVRCEWWALLCCRHEHKQLRHWWAVCPPVLNLPTISS